MKAGTGCVDAVESEVSRRVNQPTTCLRLTASLIPTTIRMAPLLRIEGTKLYHKGGELVLLSFACPRKAACASEIEISPSTLIAIRVVGYFLKDEHRETLKGDLAFPCETLQLEPQPLSKA